MTTHYEPIELRLSSTIEQAVNQLLQVRQEGKFASADFNGFMLYSDTVTMDDAYLTITGETKAQYDASIADYQRLHEQAVKDHTDNIPNLTAFWIAKGNAILSKDRHEKWAEEVPRRVTGAYRGNDLSNCLELVEILNNGGTLDQAKDAIKKQDHSGMSFSQACLLVEDFAERGKEFTDYVAV